MLSLNEYFLSRGFSVIFTGIVIHFGCFSIFVGEINGEILGSDPILRIHIR